MTNTNTETQALESTEQTAAELSENQLDDVAGGGARKNLKKMFPGATTKSETNKDGTQDGWVANASVNAAH